MTPVYQTDSEVARAFGERLREYRVSERGAAMTQKELAKRTGVSVTAISRLENTGSATMMTVLAVLRVFGRLDALLDVVPDLSAPTPMERLEQKPRRQKAWAPRRPRGGATNEAKKKSPNASEPHPGNDDSGSTRRDS